MKTYCVRLIPITSFQAFPSSDTLFGALCWGIKRLYGTERLLEILCQFDTDCPPFVLSSAFPLLAGRNDASLFFYPKPITAGLRVGDVEDITKTITGKDFKKALVEVITKYKKFKKLEYLSESLFTAAVKGAPEKDLFNEYLKDGIKPVGPMLMKKDECICFWGDSNSKAFKTETVQKNSIDRLTMSTGGDGQTFYQSEIYISAAVSLHFLIKTSGIDLLVPVLKYLEDKGIGGNRSTGKGRFKIELMGEKVSPTVQGSQAFVNLSRFIPSNEEIYWDSTVNCYDIFPYRSKVESEGEFKGEDIWKHKIMYLKEGSVLMAKEQKSFYGFCPVVKEIDGQKIRQNGMAFPVFGTFGGSR